VASPTDPIARASTIPPGSTHRIERNGEAILLCNVAGAIYAIEDACTHDGSEFDTTELDGCRIMCPRHGAMFDVTTGEALSLPAIVPLRTYSVRTEGDGVFLD
jgi:3-phenylpropionate/trans-cinnamate dioxygenase ferredoxin subunit